MAEDERSAPDFKDLLAAFDISDVSAAASQNKMLKNNHDQVNHIQQADNHNKEISNNNDKRNSLSESKSEPSTTNENEDSNSNEKHTAVNGSASAKTSSYRNMFQNLKEEMDMYQLSTNPLPSYMPAIPPQARFNLNAPADGFKCLDCNDTFLFEGSLIQHMQRRSVYITFNCDTCKKLLIYYNRCSLLSHIRSHLEKNEVADIKKATVNPLPPELMNGFHSFVPPFPMLPAAMMQHLQLQQPLSLMVPTSQMSNLHTPVSTISPKITSHSLKSPKHLKTNSEKDKYTCTECGQSYGSADALEEHFGCSQNLPLGSSQCSKCKMTCASKCSLSAHERIHLDFKPYVCPECGTSVVNREAFIHHVTTKCIHYSRVIGYKCSSCLILHSDPIKMRQHIIDEHTEAYYKCQACPMAFKASHSFESHKKTAHLTMDVDCNTIFKCPLCDIVFQGDIKLHEHLDAHIKEQIQNIKFVFKCMACSELFSLKSSLKDHLAENHPEMLEKESCPHCEAVLDSVEELEKHLKENHFSADESKESDKEEADRNKVENSKQYDVAAKGNGTQQSPCVCSSCGDVFHDLNGYFTHKKSCSSPSLQCNVCNFVSKDRLEIIKNGRQHLQEGTMVCLFCNNKGFENKKFLFKHLECHVPSNSPMDCDLCDFVTSDGKDYLKHIRSEHGFNPVKCDMCDAEFYGSARMQRHKTAMHSNPSKDLVCPLCNEDSFATQGFLDKHFILSHNLSLEEIAELRDHSPNYFQSNKSKEAISDIKSEPSCSDGNTSSKSPSSLSSDFNADLSKHDDSDSPPPCKRLELESNCIESKAVNNFRFSCYKCDFNSDDRSVFWKHIAIHKVDQSAFQCLECGCCYVAIPSLRKHMFLAHNIRDFDAYVAEAGQHMISNHESFSSKNGTSFNCDVCCQCFNDEVSLKNHMQNHGQAFVRFHSTSLGLTEEDDRRSN